MVSRDQGQVPGTRTRTGYQGQGPGDQGPRTRDQGTMDQGPGTKDQGLRTMDQGPGTKDQGPSTRDCMKFRTSGWGKNDFKKPTSSTGLDPDVVMMGVAHTHAHYKG